MTDDYKTLTDWANDGEDWSVESDGPGLNYSATATIDGGGWVSVFADGGVEVTDSDGYVFAFVPGGYATNRKPATILAEAALVVAGERPNENWKAVMVGASIWKA